MHRIGERCETLFVANGEVYSVLETAQESIEVSLFDGIKDVYYLVCYAEGSAALFLQIVFDTCIDGCFIDFTSAHE